MRSIVPIFFLTLGLLLRPAALRADTETHPDLSGSHGETVFFLLGMLDEHGNGRMFMEDSDGIEHFYCNEPDVAFVFRAYLERLAGEQGLDPAIEDRWRQDCLVDFYSEDLSGYINGFYSYEYADGIHAMTEQGPKRMGHASLSYAQLEHRDRALQLAYLAGAYFRYGSGDQFRVTQSPPKLELVTRLLDALGCDHKNILPRRDSPRPGALVFTATDELTNAFARLPAAWAYAAADSTVGRPVSDELAIYRELIQVARGGRFDGCPLPERFSLYRFTTIPMKRGMWVPGVSLAQQQALEQYDSVSVTLRSLSDLADDFVEMISFMDLRPGVTLRLGRIGYSPDARVAATVLGYRDNDDLSACHRLVTVFLSRKDDGWVVSDYSLYEDRR